LVFANVSEPEVKFNIMKKSYKNVYKSFDFHKKFSKKVSLSQNYFFEKFTLPAQKEHFPEKSRSKFSRTQILQFFSSNFCTLLSIHDV